MIYGNLHPRKTRKTGNYAYSAFYCLVAGLILWGGVSEAKAQAELLIGDLRRRTHLTNRSSK